MSTSSKVLATCLIVVALWQAKEVVQWFFFPSNTVIVSGTLYYKDVVYKPEKTEQVMVSFAEQVGGQFSGKTFPARLDGNGRFKITGPNGNGIPLGTFRVGITSMPENPAGGPKEAEQFAKYDVQDSPIVIEVSRASKQVDLKTQ